MKFNYIISKDFSKEFKNLLKKYPSLKSDFQEIVNNLEKELALSDDLGNGFKKIRISIKSKGKGSRGGGRIITYETIIAIDETQIIFATIYNKGEYDDVDLKILRHNLGLE